METKIMKVELEIVVTKEDIDDIIAGAIEGGINYWCDEVKVMGDYLGEYASEQISKGGQLLLHDIEEDEIYTLDKEKFLNGLMMYLEKQHSYEIIEKTGNKLKINTCNVDAEICDMIIQFALFDYVIYG